MALCSDAKMFNPFHDEETAGHESYYEIKYLSVYIVKAIFIHFPAYLLFMVSCYKVFRFYRVSYNLCIFWREKLYVPMFVFFNFRDFLRSSGHFDNRHAYVKYAVPWILKIVAHPIFLLGPECENRVRRLLKKMLVAKFLS